MDKINGWRNWWHRNKNTWDLVDLPDDKNCIGVKWIYKTNLNANGDVEKYEARLVAQGFSQQTSIDYNEVFAPVAILDTSNDGILYYFS